MACGGVWWRSVVCFKGAHIIARRVAVDVAVVKAHGATIDMNATSLQINTEWYKQAPQRGVEVDKAAFGLCLMRVVEHVVACGGMWCVMACSDIRRRAEACGDRGRVCAGVCLYVVPCRGGRCRTKANFPFVTCSPSSRTVPLQTPTTLRALSPSRIACPEWSARMVMSLRISSTLVPFPVYVPLASTSSSPALALFTAVCRLSPGLRFLTARRRDTRPNYTTVSLYAIYYRFPVPRAPLRCVARMCHVASNVWRSAFRIRHTGIHKPELELAETGVSRRSDRFWLA